MRHKPQVLLLLGLQLFFGACAALRSLPAGPTPIPTLIPATEPASSLGATPAPSFAILSYPARLPSAALGQPLYQTHCARCHGADGKGVVPGARNFNDLDYMRGESPVYFYATVAQGRGQMPAFREQLSETDIKKLAVYVYKLGK